MYAGIEGRDHCTKRPNAGLGWTLFQEFAPLANAMCVRERAWWIVVGVTAATTICCVRSDTESGAHVLAPGRALQRQTIAAGLWPRPSRARSWRARLAHASPAVTHVVGLRPNARISAGGPAAQRHV